MTTAKRRRTRTPRSTGRGSPRLPRKRSWFPRRAGIVAAVLLLAILALTAGYLLGQHDWVRLSAEEPLVVRVIDGDTVELADGSRVRYLCIDTPERGEPFYEDATERNRELVEGKVVVLESGLRDRDVYGRLLRYVYVDDVFVNAELVREGLATTLIFDEDELYVDLLRLLESDAQAEGRGIWGLSDEDGTAG